MPLRGSVGMAMDNFCPGLLLQSCFKGWCQWLLLCPGERSQDLAFLRCCMVWDVAGCSMARRRQGIRAGLATCGRLQQRMGLVPPWVAGPVVLLWP